MREMGLEAWRWIAAGVLMGILTAMMVLGLGARRGTPLYRFRLSLWMLVLGLGGAASGAGCDGRGLEGEPDATDGVTGETCYADVGFETVAEPVEDPARESDMSTCYIPPDPGWEPPPEPVPDGSTDPSVELEDAEEDDA